MAAMVVATGCSKERKWGAKEREELRQELEVLATPLGDESCHVDVLDIVAKFLHSNV